MRRNWIAEIPIDLNNTKCMHEEPGCEASAFHMNRMQKLQDESIFHQDDKAQPLNIQVRRVYCVAYSGRNQARVKERIDQLARIEVPVSSRTPAVYSVSTYLLTLNNRSSIMAGLGRGRIHSITTR